MANGMAGALIVEGDGTAGKVQDLEAIPEIAAARERILVLQQLTLQQENGVGWVDPNDVYQEPPNPSAYWPTAINGVVMPTFTMHPKEVERWRVIHAGREGPLLLCWCNERGGLLENLPFYEIAVDGLATGQTCRAQGLHALPRRSQRRPGQGPRRPGDLLPVRASGGRVDPRPGACIIKHLAKLVVQGAERDMKLPVAGATRPLPAVRADRPGGVHGQEGHRVRLRRREEILSHQRPFLQQSRPVSIGRPWAGPRSGP